MNTKTIWPICLVLLASCGGGGSGSNDTPAGFNGTVSSITLASDGSDDIYVGGEFTSYAGTVRNRIARINSDLSIDIDFDPGAGFDGRVSAIETANGSNDINAGGEFATYDGTSRSCIARINSDGSLDTTFDPGTGCDSTVSTVVNADNVGGVIYIGGDFTTFNGNSAAESLIPVDGSGIFFGGGGIDTLTGFNSNVFSAVVEGGELIAGGSFTRYDGTANTNRIARINSGSTDLFSGVGSRFNGTVYSLLLAGDGTGDIYVGGDFTSYNGVTRNRVARLNSDGSLDTAFATGSGFDGAVRTLALATDSSGDVYAGGEFTTYRLNDRNGIARINNDSSNDAAFDPGMGFNGVVHAITPANNGSGDLYVGGNFTTYQGNEANRIIRLDSAGTSY